MTEPERARRAAGRVTRRKLLHSRAFQRSNEHATSLISLLAAAVAAISGALNRRVPVVSSTNGIYTGCGPVGVKYYGHGYGVAVGPSKVEAGLATNWHDDGYGWTGLGAPGDSGSPVLTADGLAAGNSPT